MINIRLIDADRLKFAFQLLKDIDLDGSKEVVIRDYKSKRSLEQNALYWRWLEAISDQTGYTIDEIHEHYKSKYMLQIYLAGTVNKKQEIWVGAYDAAREDGTDVLMQRVMQLLSTTWANTEQFKKYMDRIEQSCIQNELHLPA